VGGDPLRGAGTPSLLVAHCALQTITQDVKPASMPAGSCGFGHIVSFDGVGVAVCAPSIEQLKRPPQRA